jgi:hypothetical protein
MNKDITCIQAQYPMYLEFDVSDVDMGNVENCYIKYTTLFIQYLDGTIQEIDSYTECEPDWKYPEEVKYFTAQGMETKDAKKQLEDLVNQENAWARMYRDAMNGNIDARDKAFALLRDISAEEAGEEE